MKESVNRLLGLSSSKLSLEQISLRGIVMLIVLYLFMLIADIRSVKNHTLLEQLISVMVVFIISFAVFNITGFFKYLISVFVLAILLRIAKFIFRKET